MLKDVPPRVSRIAQRRTDENSVAVGVFMQIGSSEVVEVAGRTGCDFVIIDCEHGSFQLERATMMCRAADAVGTTPLVRVPDNDASFIMRVLDAGAMGIVVPHATSKEQLEAIVSATRFKEGNNGGIRGTCPGTRASWHQTSDWNAYFKWANETIAVWALIESAAGVSNIDQIMQVRGVNAVVLGAFDLAHDMGYPGQVNHPLVRTALAKVVERANRSGTEVVSALFCTSPEEMAAEYRYWLSQGVRIFVLGSDRRLIVSAFLSAVQVTRAG